MVTLHAETIAKATAGTSAIPGTEHTVPGVCFPVVAAGIVLGLWWIVDNTVTNLGQQNKSVGFGFLFQTAGFQINTTLGTWMFDCRLTFGLYRYPLHRHRGHLHCRLFRIFAATFSGFSGHRAAFAGYRAADHRHQLSRSSAMCRFCCSCSSGISPYANDAEQARQDRSSDVIGVNITGLYMRLIPAGLAPLGYAFLIAVLITIGINQFASRRQLATGSFPTFWAGLGVSSAACHRLQADRQPARLGVPVFKETGAVLRRGYQQGVGILVIPEMIAVWLALSLYTSAFIAEIVGRYPWR